MSIFSVRLQEIRKERGLTRQEVADHLNITVRAYQFYEEGKREPKFENLTDLARHLKVSTDFLLGLTDKP